jgi:hypothetical protein
MYLNELLNPLALRALPPPGGEILYLEKILLMSLN